MKTPTVGQLVMGLAAVAVVGTVVAGLIFLGSPTEERARRIDQKRVEDLRRIADAIDLHWTRESRLPDSLEELAKQPGVGLNIRDPATAEAYEYHPKTADSYQLCATFERNSAERSRGSGGFWSHGAGRQCFELKTRSVRR